MCLLGRRRRPAAGPTARAVGRSDWANREFRRGQGGLVVQCAGRPVGFGGQGHGPPMPRGRVGASRGAGIPSLGRWRTAGGCGDPRHAGHVLGEGRCGVRWHAVAGGGEVWPTKATRCATPWRLGCPRAARSAGDSSPGQGGVRRRVEPTPPPPRCQAEIGRGRGVTNR